MKKINLLLCALLMASMAFAQRTKLVMSTPDLGVTYAVYSLSPNGKWACGGIYDGVERGFLWNLSTGEIIELSEQGTQSNAKSVSDNGVVSGAFETTEGTPNNRPILTYGVWKEGVWTPLEIYNEENDAEITREGYASTISRNGEYIAGIAHSGNYYKPIVWNNGKLNIVDDIEGAVYDISDNGDILCGWTTHPVKKNRTSVVWTRNNEGSYDKNCLDLTSPYAAGPFSVATGMSPNCKYIIACNTIYNIETGDTIRHDIDGNYRSGFELSGITNDGTAYGFVDNGEVPGGEEKIAVMISLDGKVTNVRDYLIGRGVNLDAYPYVQNLVSVSEDMQTYVVSAYSNDFVESYLVIKLSADIHMPPVSLNARRLEGVNGYSFTWNKPLYTTEAPVGYNIYRDGEKINTEVISTRDYVDSDVTEGEYQYTVSAVYADGKESKMSQQLDIKVTGDELNAPIQLHAYTSSLNDARIIWEKPYTNLPALSYVDDNDAVYGLGADVLNFECGIAARASELKLYKDAGYKISKISFIPKSRQNSWTVNFYIKDNYDKPIYSEVIPSDNLKYGMVNYHTLKTPLEIPEGKDVVMAIYIDVTNYGGLDVIGMNTKKAYPGYSDLIRRDGEKNMYSLYEEAMNSEYGAMEYNLRWSIGMYMSKGNETDEVKQYVISANGNEIGTTSDNKFRVSNLKNGNYEFGVAAEYADGSKSMPRTASLDILADKKICKTVVPSVTSDDSKATLTWDAPAAEDVSVISYANNTPNGGVLARKDMDYSYVLASIYKGDALVPFEGYEIKALRFYPLSDAQFTFHLIENETEEVATVTLVKGEGYEIDEWNTLQLEKPVKINRNSTYKLAVECNDCTPKEHPMGMDNQTGYPYVSDLLSIDGGFTYGSVYLDGGKNGNWMIGLDVASIEKFNLPVEGYNIYLNDNLSSEMLNANTYEFSNLESGKYQVNVNPVYPNGIGEMKSAKVTFEITVNGIDDITSSTFDVVRNADQIKVNGGNVSSIEIYDINGSKVAVSCDNIISIASLSDGIYVMNVTVDGKKVRTKISIRK